MAMRLAVARSAGFAFCPMVGSIHSATLNGIWVTQLSLVQNAEPQILVRKKIVQLQYIAPRHLARDRAVANPAVAA